MSQRRRESRRKVWRLSAIVGFGLIAGQSAIASPSEKDHTPLPTAAQEREKAQSPMYGSGASSAPYRVRLRITGFLARQHARDGNSHRALVEFHSMLNVDEPSWTDDIEGDSMRIARDIEVAQMMAEVGFYDHAVRVLETSLILARVNEDPEASLVERQIVTITQLARAKGSPAPLISLDGSLGGESGDRYSPVRQATGSMLAREQPEPADDFPAEPRTLKESPSKKAVAPRPLPELPPATLNHEQANSAPEPIEQSEKKSGGRFRLSNLIPSRWHQKKSETAAESDARTTVVQRRPMVSPDVSPTYCQECATQHGASHLNAASRSGSPEGSASSRLVSKPVEVSEGPVPTSTEATKSKSTTKPFSSKDLIQTGHQSAQYKTQSAVEKVKSRAVISETDSAETKAEELVAREEDSQNPIPQFESLQGSDGRDRNIDGEAVSTDSTSESVTQPLAPNLRPQIGFAGHVSNPGIFSLEGTSTTLAALLRRSGDPNAVAGKQARILRSVDLHSAADPNGQQKDFYCQRVEITNPADKALETPIYGQEIVIVEGSEQKPLYIAVMPHFILQIPVTSGHSVTAEQIIDQIRVHWPNIRNQEMGVLRFDNWGHATKFSDLREGDSSLDTPLEGGDVLYVDGMNLDRSQVMSAAEAVAKLVGVKVRSPQRQAVKPAKWYPATLGH